MMIMASTIQQQASSNTAAVAVAVTAAALPASPALSQVLQSESVRRLFNQPNIVIHAIPRTNSPTAFRMVRPTIPTCAEPSKSVHSSSSSSSASPSGEHQTSATPPNISPAKPEVSIRVINPPSDAEASEPENLLPSKTNGKSEILLVPVVRKRKSCGHFEPCESLVCSVNFKQHEDEDGQVTPLISLSIDEDEEIDAKVAKHCENNQCDALSIDHDRCRAASVELYRCDKSSLCDVCGIAFQGETRLDHKKCRRKHVYQHNTATPGEVFRYRMMQRELQMIEAAKSKRSSDYLDPVLGMTRTIEALSNNDELIIIPKMPPFPPKIVKPCLAPLSAAHKNLCDYSNGPNNNISTSKNNNLRITTQPNSFKRIRSDDHGLTSERISSIIESCKQRIELEKQQDSEDEEDDGNQIQIKLADHGSLNGATVRIVDLPGREKHRPIDLPLADDVARQQQQQQQFMASAGLHLTSVNDADSPAIPELDSANEVKAELRKINKMGLPSEPYKVVPIVELKSEPSLRDQKQGVPRFCVVPADMPPLQKLKEKNLNKLEKPILSPKKNKRKDEEEVNNKRDEETKKSPSEKKNSPKKPEQNGSTKEKKSPVAILPKFTGLVKSSKHPAEKLLLSNSISIVKVNATNNHNNVGQTSLSKKPKICRKRMKKLATKLGKKFRCSHCAKCFSSLDYCRQHIAQHENKPDFFCRICERGFVSKVIMKKHQEAEHKADEVRCEMCNRVMPSSAELARHVNDKSSQRCTDCKQEFTTCANLEFHMRKQHGYLVCVLCNRQIAKSMAMRHLMLEHSLSKRRSESSFEKLTQQPGKNDPIRQLYLSKSDEVHESSHNSSNSKQEVTRRSSSRRRSSKEFFACNVCERRFDSEKQYQIHVANYPMKFTPCLDCGKKFHRKVEYTEHSKTCHPTRSEQFNNKVEPRRKKRKSNLISDNVVLKSDIMTSRNSIDQKQNESLASNKCKKLKIKENIVVQTVDYDDDKKEDECESEKISDETEDYKDKNVVEDEESNLEMEVITVETKTVNGLKRNSSDCLDTLDNDDVVEAENFVKIEDVDVDNEALLLSDEQSQMNSAKTAAELDTLSSIIQDHNYQVLQK